MARSIGAVLSCYQSCLLLTILAAFASIASGCFGPPTPLPDEALPRVAPENERPPSGGAFPLDASQVEPMYSEVLPIDLQTVAQVAVARNLDIQLARQRVQSMHGKLESSTGAAFPVFAPTFLFEQVDGAVRATEGNLVDVDFRTFLPSALVQWVLNPGKVVYDIIASRKRLLASQYQERAELLQVLQRSALQYYELVFAQYGVAAARQSVDEAQELLRITQARFRRGSGLGADEMQAKAALAGREQEMLRALKTFYDASITLATTLHLDATVTLVPNIHRLSQVTLVRDDLAIEDLMKIALDHRDDLHGVRALVEAAGADHSAAWWASFGPHIGAAYQYGGIAGRAEDVNSGQDETFALHHQERVAGSVGFRFGLSLFGDLDTVSAEERQVIVKAEKALDRVSEEVVRAHQDSKVQGELVKHASEELLAADEALRLARANLRAGTMTTLDVLHAENTLAHARLHYAAAVTRYDQAQVNLLAALGLLREGSLAEHDRQ